MLAFSSIIVNPLGEYQVHDGTLFSLPAELCDNHRVQQYLKISALGWTKSEFGYMALVRVDSQGNKYIIPGLLLEGCDRPTKKFHGYKVQFTKEQVEQYLDHHLERLIDVRNSSEDELTALVHDLRHLSSSIYHSALEAESAAKSKSWNDIRDLIGTIIASQTMLKVRIDYLDFSNSVDRFDDIEKIPVYSRVDKVIRCFRAAARLKNINIFLKGESYRLAEGPNILDIVPYTLIENAIKYAPNHSDVSVEVADTDSTTKVLVVSLGPALDANEVNQIFEKGFRGKIAALVRTSGTGLGLSVARNVIEIFSGKIFAEQSSESELRGNIPYAETKFHFSLPTSGEDNFRRKKFETLNKKRVHRRTSSIT